MVLKCSKCGWIGVNLIPDEKNNRALCPKCKETFFYSRGVPFLAKDAIAVTEEEEKEIIKSMVGCGK